MTTADAQALADATVAVWRILCFLAGMQMFRLFCIGAKARHIF